MTCPHTPPSPPGFYGACICCSIKRGSPLRRYLRAEKAKANTQTAKESDARCLRHLGSNWVWTTTSGLSVPWEADPLWHEIP
jgi:hypothetical protein